MWFNLDGDKRLGRCATQGCGEQPVYRLEVGGTGSNFCSGCRELIESQTSRCFDALARPKIIEVDYGKSPAVSTEVEGHVGPDGTVKLTRISLAILVVLSIAQLIMIFVALY